MRRMLHVVLALCILGLCFDAVPLTGRAEISGKCGDNLHWTMDDDGTLTISGSGSVWPFAYNSLNNIRSLIKKVVIEPGVTSLGVALFQRCTNLTEVSIPDTVIHTGYSTFSNCISLTDIALPDSVVYLEDGVFEYCHSLTSVTIPESVVSIGARAFSNCSRLMMKV